MAWIKWLLGTLHWKWYALLAHLIVIVLILLAGTWIASGWVGALWFITLLCLGLLWFIQIVGCFKEENTFWDDSAIIVMEWFEEKRDKVKKWWATRPGNKAP